MPVELGVSLAFRGSRDRGISFDEYSPQLFMPRDVVYGDAL